jgi:hypothetical protein
MQHLKSTDCQNFENFKRFFKKKFKQVFNFETNRYDDVGIESEMSEFYDVYKIKLTEFQYIDIKNFYSTINNIVEEKIELHEHGAREVLASIGITANLKIVSHKDGLTKFKIHNYMFGDSPKFLIVNDIEETFQFDFGKWIPIHEYHRNIEFSQFRLQMIQRQINQEVMMK